MVKYVDISFNSEIETIKKLDEEAKIQNKVHGILITYELGDLREGCNKNELFSLLEKCLKFKNIKVWGIASNLSCFGGIIPTNENMNELKNIALELNNKFGINLQIVSAPNTSSFKMLEKKLIPNEVNSVRIGEAIFCGYNTSFCEKIDSLSQDTFILKAEVVEVKNKPSIPWGVCMVDAQGNKPCFEDKGIRKRALIGIGNEDINIFEIFPKDKQIEILGGCSNYTVLDVTDCDKDYKVGDVIEFNISYFSLLKSMMSKFVEIKF